MATITIISVNGQSPSEDELHPTPVPPVFYVKGDYELDVELEKSNDAPGPKVASHVLHTNSTVYKANASNAPPKDWRVDFTMSHNIPTSSGAACPLHAILYDSTGTEIARNEKYFVEIRP